MRDLPAAPVIPVSIHGGVAMPPPIAADGLPAGDPLARAWAVLGQVLDPEVPALSVVDLGIVREVAVGAAEGGAQEQAVAAAPSLDVWLTPTYSGCPATEAIEAAVRLALQQAGFSAVRVHLRRAPAWTTDWISAEGRAKLKAYGIAPPAHVVAEGDAGAGADADSRVVPIRIVRRSDLQPVACPHCDSPDTERLSAFGSTACKSLWRCRACREPFEHFKPI